MCCADSHRLTNRRSELWTGNLPCCRCTVLSPVGQPANSQWAQKLSGKNCASSAGRMVSPVGQAFCIISSTRARRRSRYIVLTVDISSHRRRRCGLPPAASRRPGAPRVAQETHEQRLGSSSTAYVDLAVRFILTIRSSVLLSPGPTPRTARAPRAVPRADSHCG
jgi:hypothetical protein